MFTGTQVLAIIQDKGGVGKSTLATGLAAVAAKACATVRLIDLDTRINAVNWVERYAEAGGKGIEAVITVASRLAHEIERARADQVDWVIIDAPAQSSHISTAAAKLADLVFVPCKAEIYAMEGLPPTCEMIRLGGNPPAFVVWNQLHPSAVKTPQELKEHTPEIAGGLPACPVHLTVQKEHPESQAKGLPQAGRAAAELEQVYLFACEQLNRKEGGHVKRA